MSLRGSSGGAAQVLGRHVPAGASGLGHRPRRDVGGVEHRECAGCVAGPSQAEVGQPRPPVAPDQDVVGVDVGVQDPLLVRGAERVGEPLAVLDDLVDRQRLAAGEAGAQAHPVHQLHHQPRHAVLLVGGEHRGDVGMQQPRRRARLAQEAPREVRQRHHLRLGSLERHQPPELDVVGAIDDPHAAAPDLRDDDVARLLRQRLPGDLGFIGLGHELQWRLPLWRRPAVAMRVRQVKGTRTASPSATTTTPGIAAAPPASRRSAAARETSHGMWRLPPRCWYL